MAKTFEQVLLQTLFEPDRNSDDPNAPNQAMCQIITRLGDWNNTTKSIDSREIVLKKDQEYSIQVFPSKFKTARGRAKFTLRISEVIDDGQGLPVKPAIRRL